MTRKSHRYHEETEAVCRRRISNIAYRFNFKVVYEDERILKEENGVQTVIVTSHDAPRNTLCQKAWRKLAKEYGYHGLPGEKGLRLT